MDFDGYFCCQDGFSKMLPISQETPVTELHSFGCNLVLPVLRAVTKGYVLNGQFQNLQAPQPSKAVGVPNKNPKACRVF